MDRATFEAMTAKVMPTPRGLRNQGAQARPTGKKTNYTLNRVQSSPARLTGRSQSSILRTASASSTSTQLNRASSKNLGWLTTITERHLNEDGVIVDKKVPLFRYAAGQEVRSRDRNPHLRKAQACIPVGVTPTLDLSRSDSNPELISAVLGLIDSWNGFFDRSASER